MTIKEFVKIHGMTPMELHKLQERINTERHRLWDKHISENHNEQAKDCAICDELREIKDDECRCCLDP